LVERTTGVATHVIVEAAATACMAFAGVGVAIARATTGTMWVEGHIARDAYG